MRKYHLALLWMSLFVFSACGSGTDPVSTLGDASQSNGPGLLLPLATVIGLNTAFYSTSPSFGLVSQGAGSAVRAPGNGLVITADTGSGTVTILHNVHVESQVTGIIPSIQVGTYVLQGTTIGTVTTSGSGIVRFSVFADSTAVCPLSYMTSGARASLEAISVTNPCPQ